MGGLEVPVDSVNIQLLAKWRGGHQRYLCWRRCEFLSAPSLLLSAAPSCCPCSVALRLFVGLAGEPCLAWGLLGKVVTLPPGPLRKQDLQDVLAKHI